MNLPSIVRLRRRKEGVSGPPPSLLNGELAFNEVNETLYYGAGDDGDGNAVSIIPIAGGFTNLIKDAELYSPPAPLSQSNDYLIININGTQKAINLCDL